MKVTAEECVYPSNHDDRFAPEYGLTKREYFAVMAMQAFIKSDGHAESRVIKKSLAAADALLAEFDK